MATTKKDYPNDKSGGLFSFLMAKYKLTTYSALSEKIDVLPHTLSRVLNGKQEVTQEARYRISKRTGLSVKKIDALIEEEK